MPRKPTMHLTNLTDAGIAFDLILRLKHAGRAGLFVEDPLGLESEVPFGRDDVEHKSPYATLTQKIDFLRDAGFDVRIVKRQNSRGDDDVWLVLKDTPFIPVSVTQAEFEVIHPLIAAFHAGQPAAMDVPAEILLSQQARDESRCLIARSADREFRFIPMGEMFDDRWLIRGRSLYSERGWDFRVGGRYTFSLGESVDTPTEPAVTQAPLVPLMWGTQMLKRVVFTVWSDAVPSVQRLFAGTDLTDTMERGEDETEFQVHVRNTAELNRVLVRLRGQFRDLYPPEIAESYREHLVTLAAIPPLSGGYQEGPRLQAKKPTMPPHDVKVEDTISAPTANANMAFKEVVGRMVLIMRHLDLHGSATMRELAEVAGTTEPRATGLVNRYNDAYRGVYLRDGLRISDESQAPVTVTRIADDLLGASGRIEVTIGQLLAAASAAVVELETTHPDADREAALRLLVQTTSDALDVDIPVDVANPVDREVVERNIGKLIHASYTNPWFATTSWLAMVPLAKPRRRNGRWVVDAVEVLEPEGVALSARPEVFYLDGLSEIEETRKPVSPGLSAAEVAEIDKRTGFTNVTLRVKKGESLDWIRATWHAQDAVPTPDLPQDEESISIRVYEPEEQRLFDLFVQTDGEALVETPVRMRTFNHDRVTEILAELDEREAGMVYSPPPSREDDDYAADDQNRINRTEAI